MCEVSERSELSPLSEAASHRRGYVSSFGIFLTRGAIGQGDQISRSFHEDDQISPLFLEGAQDVQFINLSILPPWVTGFRAGEAKLVSMRLVLERDFEDGGSGPNKSARNAP